MNQDFVEKDLGDIEGWSRPSATEVEDWVKLKVVYCSV